MPSRNPTVPPPTVMILPEIMRDAPLPAVDLLQQGGFAVRYPQNRQLARGAASAEEVIAELSDVNATIASSEPYTADILAALPRLRVIARAGVGYDAVDVAAATARKVAVTITPTANHEAVAELALALLFAVTKSIVSHDSAIRGGEWPRVSLRPLRSRTLGILGLGRIGRSLAVRAAHLGMQVIAHETQPDSEFVRRYDIVLVPFETLLERSDFISLHCPLTDETRGLFDRQVFQRMKEGSILINTSRGRLVNEEALCEALQSGHLAGAGLDVFEREPPSPDNPLLGLRNVVASPHLGGVDHLSIEAMSAEAAAAIVQLSRNQWPDDCVVNGTLRDSWNWAG